MSAALGRVCVTGRMPEGMVFCPFHFPEQPASRAVSGELEEVSQALSKGAAARIERLPPG